jgi:sulfide dehydrogenase cytochrome subunit
VREKEEEIMSTARSAIATLISAILVAGMPLSAMSDTAKLAADRCEGCHGRDGNSEQKDVPSIAGFSEIVIADALWDYKEGYRTSATHKINGKETDMNAIAKELDDQQIESLAAYYSDKTFQPHAQTVDAALARKGKELHERNCEKCHSEGGSAADDDAAILAGQWMPYLEAQFKLFRAGERHMPRNMEKKLEALSDADVTALLHYYAGQE